MKQLNSTIRRAAVAESKAADKSKQSKDKKLKVPNFNKFRLRLIIGALVLIVLIVAWILANIILPKASIVVATDTSSTNSNVTVNLSTTASSLNTTTLTVPSHLQQTQKTQSQQVPTTGQKNEGTPATGSVIFTVTTDCQTLVNHNLQIDSGAGITANGLTYITQSTANSWTQAKSNSCQFVSTAIKVSAQDSRFRRQQLTFIRYQF